LKLTESWVHKGRVKAVPRKLNQDWPSAWCTPMEEDTAWLTAAVHQVVE